MAKHKQMLDRLSEMEFRASVSHKPHALVMHDETETPEQGWRRYNGDMPFPDPALYTVTTIVFVEGCGDRYCEETADVA